jgi:hypothetical protein
MLAMKYHWKPVEMTMSQIGWSLTALAIVNTLLR